MPSSDDASTANSAAAVHPADGPPAGKAPQEATADEPDRSAAARELARKLSGGTQSFLGLVVATVVGTAIGNLLIRYLVVTFGLLVTFCLLVLGLYYWGTLLAALGRLSRRTRRAVHAVHEKTPTPPAQERAPRAPRPDSATESAATLRRRRLVLRMRGGTAVLAGVLAPCCYVLGYWVIGNGFAHGRGLGTLSLLLALVIVAAVILGARLWQRSWPPWLRYRARTAMVCCVAAAGLSAGATLGSANLAPTCAIPAELTVLTAQEDLGAVQAAIPGFERSEPARLHTACYPVDVTAYAAPTDDDAWQGFQQGWDPTALKTVGPRPDVWIPASSDELATVRENNGPPLTSFGSIASSPLVVAVPAALVSGPLARLRQLGTVTTWDSIYTALSQTRAGRTYLDLALTDPARSEAARLGIAGLYPALSLADERQIESSGTPPDSGDLLCDAAQKAEQGTSPPAAAYLVSEAAMIASNHGELTAGACATLTLPPAPLTAFYPAGAAALDFPFATVNWGGDTPTSAVLSRYETDFYDWLTGQARSTLIGSGLRPPGCGRFSRPPPGVAAACPATGLPTVTEIDNARYSFQNAQAPAHIVVGIDDSGPMDPYLPQITAAVDAELGPGATHIGSEDSFGIWELPGDQGQIDKQLVGFGVARVTEGQVPAGVGVLTGHGHSADYAMLTNAGELLYRQPAAASEPINSVILLTDGDGYPQGDPGGSSQTIVTGHFNLPPPGHSAIKLYIIAFGPEGCAETESAPGQSLAAFANATGGICLPANGADPDQLLEQVLGQISTGG